MQDLAETSAIRWADVDAGGLSDGEALALFDPICRGELNSRIARDLVSPHRYPAGRYYRRKRIAITSAFRIRHLAEPRGVEDAAAGAGAGGVTSVFEPMHLLTGEGWLITSWLPPRVFRGRAATLHGAPQSPDGVYAAVAKRWCESDADSAEALAELVRRELAVAAGYRPLSA